MAFGLGKLADPLHEGERFPEIVESKCALDAAGFMRDLEAAYRTVWRDAGRRSGRDTHVA